MLFRLVVEGWIPSQIDGSSRSGTTLGGVHSSAPRLDVFGGPCFGGIDSSHSMVYFLVFRGTCGDILDGLVKVSKCLVE